MIVAHFCEADRASVLELAEQCAVELDLDAELAKPHAFLLVARQANDAAQTLGLALYWQLADEFELIQLATHPSARRRGIARLLLDEIRQHAERAAARGVFLEVRRSNMGACELYRRAGFSTLGLRPGYYDQGKEDAVLMCLEIRSPTNQPNPDPIEE
jgi:ribosomal-protein-alanine N-acetyltransferase